MVVDVVIPALNEEPSIALALGALRDDRIRHRVVVDNGSTDGTAAVAAAAGAVVISEPRRGYGQACLTGLRWLASDPPDVVLFLDGDYSDVPEDATVLLDAIAAGAELVIGSRTRGGAQPGALLPQARFGNWLATTLIRLLYGASFTDLGPFRAITWDGLQRVNMQDRDFGWTVEMQVRAARQGLRCDEVSVRYRPRIGVSKVTGTVVGSVRAGHKILWVIARDRLVSP